MNILFNNIKIVFVFVLFACCLFLSDDSFAASTKDQSEKTDTSSSFELRALIMEIDLEKGFIVIAEQEIELPQAMQNGKKEWLTKVVDSNGQTLSMTSLKRRDRVLVTGTASIEKGMKAEQITLLASKEAERKDAKQSSSQIYQQNGVWKN